MFTDALAGPESSTRRQHTKAYAARYPRWSVGAPLLYSSCILAALGDALFGYSQGVIAAVQVQPSFIRRVYGADVMLKQVQAGDDGVDVFAQGIVVACLNLAAFFASFAAAYICDILGRRAAIRTGAILYLIASLIQIFTPNLAALIAGRCVQGLGAGILYTTVPIYQCEIAPRHSRALFVSLEYICLNAGYALSAWVGYAFFFYMPREISWQGPFIVQAALAVLLIAASFVIPESPRWLIKNGFKYEGLQTLADLHAGGDAACPDAIIPYGAIEATVFLEDAMGPATWGQLFTLYGRRTVVGVTCQLFAQFNGISAFLYFLPENLARAGFDVQRALVYAGVCALVYCAGTIPTVFGLDRWGRRRFLLGGSVGLMGALALIGGLQYHSESLPQGNARMSSANGIFAGVCIYLFIFGATWGPIPLLIAAEVFPLRARAKGVALSTSVNWLSNFVVVFITPPLFSALGAGYYFLLLGFTAVSAMVVFLLYPEMAGRTLEEVGEAFGDAGHIVSNRALDAEMRISSDSSLEKNSGDEDLEEHTRNDLPRTTGRRGRAIVSADDPLGLGLIEIPLNDEQDDMSDIPLDDEEQPHEHVQIEHGGEGELVFSETFRSNLADEADATQNEEHQEEHS